MGNSATIWFGAMPESNGRSNWTALLISKEQAGLDAFVDAVTIERSEYKDRVRYAADRARWVLGELPQRPDVLDYDPDLTEAAPRIHPMTETDAIIRLVEMAEAQGRYWRDLQRSARSREDKTTFAVKAEPWEDAARNARAAYEAAKPAPKAERQGWVLVPMELTHEMRVAVSKAVGAPSFCDQVWEAAIGAVPQRQSGSTAE